MAGSKNLNHRKSGLDYLEFWAFGEFERTDALEQIQAAQEGAKAANASNRYCRVDGLELEVLAFGGGPGGVYRRELQFNVGGVYFGICKPNSDSKRPDMKVEIKGDQLLQLGEKAAFEFVHRVFAKLGFRYERSQVKRIDIRSDFESFTPTEVFELFREEHHVKRAAKLNFWTDELKPKIVRTINVGCRRKGGTMCRIYDKLAEIKGNEKKEALVYGIICEGEEPEQLTRVEFELRREALRDKYLCQSVEDVLNSLQRIVIGLTADWLRLEASPVDRNNTQRRKSKLHPIWEEIQEAFVDFAERYPKMEVKTYVVDEQPTAKSKTMAGAYLAKVAAGKGKVISSVKGFLEFMSEEFGDAGEFIVWFGSRVKDEMQRSESRRLEGALAFFDNQLIPKQSLLFGDG